MGLVPRPMTVGLGGLPLESRVKGRLVEGVLSVSGKVQKSGIQSRRIRCSSILTLVYHT